MKNKSQESTFWKYIFAGIFIGTVIKVFVFDILSVQGISMEPAIHDNEKILVCKLSYGIVNPFGNSTLIRWKNARTGDIVIYYYKNNLVVKGMILAIGDNFENSIDSRTYGFVAQKNILGKVIFK